MVEDGHRIMKSFAFSVVSDSVLPQIRFVTLTNAGFAFPKWIHDTQCHYTRCSDNDSLINLIGSDKILHDEYKNDAVTHNCLIMHVNSGV